jgi:hypothetical protein
MKYLFALTGAAIIGLGGPAVAQASHQGHDPKVSTEDTVATKAYREANKKCTPGWTSLSRTMRMRISSGD